MEGLGDRSAAQYRPPFQDAYLQAGRGEVAGAGQAVVTTADDQCIEHCIRHLSLRVGVCASVRTSAGLCD